MPIRRRPGQHLQLRMLRPRESSPPRGRSQGHAFAGKPGPPGRWSALGGKGAVASGCGPGAADHRRTKERQPRWRRYIGCGAARPASPDGFVWPPGRVRKRDVPGAAELIAHAAPSGDQAPRSRWPRVRIPYPGPKGGNRIGRRKFRNRNEHRPYPVARRPGCHRPGRARGPRQARAGGSAGGAVAEPARTSGPVIR
jgi:hypothetical protein